MKKQSMQARVLELIKVGTWSKKEIAHQLSTSVAAVATHMTYLRWKGHFIIYDLDTMNLQLTDEAGYLAWAESKKKPEPTPEEICIKARKKVKALKKSLVSWKAIYDQEHEGTLTKEIKDQQTEASAHIFLLELELKRTAALIKTNSSPSVQYRGGIKR